MEKYRPQIHFTAEKYIINDPNGLVYYDGEYHLFHQYNINEEIYWGHAISTDLVHWKRLPNAIAPDDFGQIWSGSAVVDEENHRMAAFFTYSERKSGRQSQGVAFSYDRGRTWEKYPDNPIVTGDRVDFRDPKVFRYENKWVMVLSGGDCVLLYESRDLIHWNCMSSFSGTGEDHSGIWECPDLFRMPVEGEEESRWVLTVSFNDGAPAGGTGMKYFVGTFDGEKFVAEAMQPSGTWIDHGKDFYAGVTWNNEPSGRRLMIAWADNWQYRDYLPTEPFKGQMSSVRELKLYHEGEHYQLKQLPVREMEMLRKNKRELSEIAIGKDEEWIISVERECFEINLEYWLDQTDATQFGIRIETGKEKRFMITFDTKAQSCTVDRTAAGMNTHEKFPGVYQADVNMDGQELHVKLLMDVSQSELFLNDGAAVMTNLLFPEEKYRIKLYAQGGKATIKKCEIYELEGNVVS